MMNGTGYSLADIAAATGGSNNRGNDGMFGGDGGWLWIIVVFALLFGWGGNGFGGFGGNGGAQGALTRADLCADMNFQSMENGIRGIQQGLCDGFYAVNTSILNGFHGVDNAVCTLGYQTAQEFRGVDNAICNLGYQTQQGFNQTNIALMQGQNALSTQLAQCCCENRAGQADIKYQMATDTCAIQNTIQNTTRDIIDNNNCNTRSILDFLVQDKISSLQAENQNLKLAASQERQNNFIVANQQAQTAELIRRLGADCPQPAYVVQPPQSVSFPLGCNGQLNVFGNNGYGYNNGCGCNSGCCGCNG